MSKDTEQRGGTYFLDAADAVDTRASSMLLPALTLCGRHPGWSFYGPVVDGSAAFRLHEAETHPPVVAKKKRRWRR